MKTYPYRKILSTLCLLALAFFAGRGMADFAHEIHRNTAVSGDLQSASYGGRQSDMQSNINAGSQGGTQSGMQGSAQSGIQGDSQGGMQSGLQGGSQGDTQRGMQGSAQTGVQAAASIIENAPQTDNWGLGFGAQGEKPRGNASTQELKNYRAYYMADGGEKRIYLTFDCGYENGNTPAILAALKKHHAPATFFVVGHFLESAPELVKEMVEEGHTVGNHTFHHPDMSKISELSAFQKELDDVRSLYRQITGLEMPMYYRPPQGKYNTENLRMAKELGYSTFFWSLAYVDWNTDAQPTHEEAFNKLITRIHPGAIVLLHNTSQTNAEILDELLTKWEEMGYTFGNLSEFQASPE